MEVALDVEIKNVSKASSFVLTFGRRWVRNCWNEWHATSFNLVLTAQIHCLRGMPSANFDKLRQIQNVVARVVASSKKRDHASPILNQLDWLPIRQCLDCKMYLFTFNMRQSAISQSTYYNRLRPTRNFRLAEMKDLAGPNSLMRHVLSVLRYPTHGTHYHLT